MRITTEHRLQPGRIAALLAIALVVAMIGQVTIVKADGPTNGVFQFADTNNLPVPTLTVTEGQSVCIPIHRGGGTADLQQVTVSATPNAGASTAQINGFTWMYVSFAGGVTHRTLEPDGSCLGTWDDAVVQGSRTVTFTIGAILGGGVAGAQSTHTLTILDNDGPQVTSLNPYSGPTAGTNTVIITGSGFTGAVCPAAVKFGGTDAMSCFVDNNTQITATAPAGAGTVNVTVTVAAQTSPNTAADDYVYTDGPRVTGVSPSSGSAAGGNTLTVSGQNLASALAVTVGGNPCTGITNNTAVSLQCTAPAKGANPNTVAVRVTTASGTSPDTPQDDYSYGGVPNITTVLPVSGPTAGGYSVTFYGANLSGTTSADLGGSPCINIVANVGSQFTCTATAHVAGLVTASIANPAGNASLGNAFTYTDAPTVTSISPNSCTVAGGSTVVVTGTGFVAGPGNTLVSFGGSPGTSVNVLSANTLTVVCPAHSVGVVDVLVTTGVGTSTNTSADDFTYGAGTLPAISSLSPASGTILGGTAVTITGINFTGATSVFFGAYACTSVVVVSSTTITCITPSQLGGVVEVVVTTPAGSNTTLGTANDFTYTGGPTIISLSPDNGLAIGNTIVTITGTSFTASGTTVRFDGILAVHSYIDSTTLIAVAPPHTAGTVRVSVTTPGGTTPDTTADDFTYTGASVPVVLSLLPNSGPVGTSVTITGTSFTGTTSVTFGGVGASYTVNSDSTITATVPSGAPLGLIDVRVTTPVATSANTANDNFTNTSSGATVSYTLYFRFTLIVWTGQNGVSALAALRGLESPDNPNTNNVLGLIGAIWRFDAATQTFKGYFPGSDGVPGANDFTTLTAGVGYFIALLNPGTVTWTTLGAN